MIPYIAMGKKHIGNLSLFLIITFIILILIGVFLVIVYPSQNQEIRECEKNSDCVKVLTTCCPCEMGGQEKCVPHGQQQIYKPSDCEENPLCLAVYSCNIKSCICSEGICIEVIEE